MRSPPGRRARQPPRARLLSRLYAHLTLSLPARCAAYTPTILLATARPGAREAAVDDDIEAVVITRRCAPLPAPADTGTRSLPAMAYLRS